MATSLVLTLAFLQNPAEAASCDSQLRRADTAKGPDLAAAYTDLARCDKATAEANFSRYMTNATEADDLVSLSKAAITADTWNPVWQMLGKITSYDARDEVANEIGALCSSDPKVVSFLQGAYFGLRDIEFQQWDNAYLTCESADLTTWMTDQIVKPPAKMFDEKYNALIGIYANKLRAGALPNMAKAAIAAAAAGPYDAILMQMDSALTGSLGDDATSADKQAYEDALVAVAQGVDPDKARSVADRLANAGSTAAAAKLLPVVFADRVQAGGSFLYGGAAVEAADCKGVKTAVVHVAQVSDPGTRWVILSAAEAPLRSAKPKLSKCTAEPDAWSVAVTPEPVKTSKDIDAWAASLAAQWTEKGYAVKIETEKAIALN